MTGTHPWQSRVMDVQAPTLIGFDAHVAGVQAAAAEFARAVSLTWLGARVPTAPDWDVLDLVAHQGMVHRWATAAMRADRESMGNAALFEREGRTATDPAAWLLRGAEDLTEAFAAAPADVRAPVFLSHAPAPREFWARRQCHETTIHAVDAVAAVLERPAQAAEIWFDPGLAADGIDEFLLGFVAHPRCELRSPTPYAVRLRATDAPVSWLVEVGDGPPTARRLTPEQDADAASDAAPDAAPDAQASPAGEIHEVTATAADLYLALWHRGGHVDDAHGVLDQWLPHTQIRWGS